MVLLWIHESERIYGDRLVSPQDLKKYRALAADLSKKMFGDLVMTWMIFGDDLDDFGTIDLIWFDARNHIFIVYGYSYIFFGMILVIDLLLVVLGMLFLYDDCS